MINLFDYLFKKNKKLTIDTIDLSPAEKAKYSKQLLDNPLFMLLLDSIKEDDLLAWENSRTIEDKQAREYVFMSVQMIERIKEKLQRFIIDNDFNKKMKEEKEAGNDSNARNG